MCKANDYLSEFEKTDPEFFEIFKNFAGNEVVNEPGKGLDDKTRYMAILAAIIGCQGADLYRSMLNEALDKAVSPIEAKEIVYQATAYLGIGRVYPFLILTNEVLRSRGVKLPLDGQSTTTPETRLECGSQTQADIFGAGWKEFYKSGPEETRHINRWLADNCFGDYYTRNGLNYQQREMITFCFLSALGTEPQLKGHIAGNVSVGNDKQILINIVSQCMPYIGYPRTLNVLRCINEVLDKN